MTSRASGEAPRAARKEIIRPVVPLQTGVQQRGRPT